MSIVANIFILKIRKLGFFSLIKLAIAFLLVVVQGTLISAEAEIFKKGSVTGLNLPRFVSAKLDKVNVRRGPGTKYQIDWIYRKTGIPLMVTAEHENWRKVIDYQNQGGWVHSRLLSGNRFVIFSNERTYLKRRPNDDSPDIAIVESGVIGKLLSLSGRWCRVSINDYVGWAYRSHVWGLFSQENLEN